MAAAVAAAEIADAAFDPEGYRQIMGVLARRLQEKVCGRPAFGCLCLPDPLPAFSYLRTAPPPSHPPARPPMLRPSQDENWRMCYKALLLLEHLLKHGPAKIVGDVQSSASVLERLAEGFDYKDANQRDHGARAALCYLPRHLLTSLRCVSACPAHPASQPPWPQASTCGTAPRRSSRWSATPTASGRSGTRCAARYCAVQHCAVGTC